MSSLNIGKTIKNITDHALLAYIKKSNTLLIGDTTLRDGEQAPGAGLNPQQKLQIARQLDKLGVDSIEVGFPASSEEDCEAARMIAGEINRPILCALSRCKREDIEITAKSLGHSKRWGINLFLATSPLLREHSIHKSKDQIIEILKDAITYARNFTDSVAFAPEDASRTEPDFLYRVYEEAIDAGAFAIGFTDTVGCLIPDEVKTFIEGIKRNVSNLNKALLAVHFHNDLGLAVANSLEAVRCQANVVQCTINGLGERAGNTSLEELVMAIKKHSGYYKIKCNIVTGELFRTSELVSSLTQIPVSLNKPIVGKNVFATEAGIHQAALLNNIETYTIIDPNEVGQDSIRLVLGRHSGKHAIIDSLKKLGYSNVDQIGEQILEQIYQRFKQFASTKKEVSEKELALIAKEVLGEK